MVGDKPRYELHFHASVQEATLADYNKIAHLFERRLIQPIVPLHQLPPDITNFCDRQKELEQITALLRQETAVVAVIGVAGVGKSALAIHVAHQLKHDFPDAQLYVNLRGTEGQPLAPLEVLASFLRAWGVNEQSMPETLADRCDLYRSLMAGKRALVLLDNAHDESQVRPLLPDSSTCAVLVTSRRQLSALDEATTLKLSVMAEPEALELLHNQIGVRTQAEPEAVKKIIDLCDRLPLAIRIAGGTLKNKLDWQLEDYAFELARERQRLGKLHLSNLDVRALLALSYQKLDANSRRLFRLLGLLTGINFAPAVAVALLESEPTTAEAAIKCLADVQLLEPASEGRYRLHDLVRLFAKEQLALEELAQGRQAARLRTCRWYLETSDMMNAALNPETRRQLAQSLVKAQNQSLEATEQNLYVQALNWFQVERLNLLASVEWAYQAQAWKIVVPLARNLVNFFNTLAYWNDWEQTHLLALEASRKQSESPDNDSGDSSASRQGEAHTLINLGNVYALQSDWEKANECYEQSLSIFSEQGFRLGVAKTMGNLANVYARQGYWGEASEYYKQSLVLFGELQDHYGEAQTLANMGILHIQQNHDEKALVLWQEALTKFSPNLPKSERVAEWIQSVNVPIAISSSEAGDVSVQASKGSTQVSRKTSTRPPVRRIFYILGGVIVVVAIALLLLLLFR